MILVNDRICQVEGNIVSDMDGEKVMLSIENGKYYNLGKVGGEIWEFLEAPMTIEELIQLILERYDVEEHECREHVISFIESLAEENLVKKFDLA